MDRLTFDSGYYNGKKESQDEVERLQNENTKLTQWVSDLQSGMYVNCIYCGHRYGPGETTPASMADALKAHVENCPKHPMSSLKADNAALRAEVDVLRDALINAISTLEWGTRCWEKPHHRDDVRRRIEEFRDALGRENNTANKVLTLEEVLVCPQGEKVWVEHVAEWRQFDGVRVVRCDEKGRLVSLAIEPNGSGWAATFVKKGMNKFLRVWALPQPPTEEEKAANPWLEQEGTNGQTAP